MVTIEEYVKEQAAKLVEAAGPREGGKLDFGLQSVGVADEMILEAASASPLAKVEREEVIALFACYLLEVARREFGGRYVHHPEYNAPVLVVGDSNCHVALLTHRKVEGRLGGDEGDNIPFFFEGFAARARGPTPDRGVLYI